VTFASGLCLTDLEAMESPPPSNNVAMCDSFSTGVCGDRTQHPPNGSVITPKGARPNKTHAYTLEEIYALLDVLQEEPARTLCLPAALSGLSQSELVALGMTLFDGEINVKRGVWHGKVSKTKTAAREESLPLLPIVKDALDAHKARTGYHEWVFHGETGNRWDGQLQLSGNSSNTKGS
jgi:integrase